MRGDTSEMSALSAEADGLEHALLEACALLDEGAPRVLLMITEGVQPEPYQPWIDDAPFPYALALVISPGRQWRLTLDSAAGATEPSTWPHALNLVRALLGDAGMPVHSCRGRHWHWHAAP